MKKKVAFDEIAKKPVRLITFLYAIVKLISYAIIEAPYFNFTLHRVWTGALMVLFVYVLTGAEFFTRRQLSVLVPLSLIAVELPFVLFIGGDRLTHFFLIGVPLLSLLYADIKGLFTIMVLIVVAKAFILFVLQMSLVGGGYTFSDEMFNFIGVSVVYLLFFLTSRYSIAAIIKAREDAESATRSRTDFVATISHEIRTPLNAILGLAQIQMEKENLPAEYASVMGKIYNSGKNQLAIINDLLDMSKMETGLLTVNRIKYSTPSMINDTVQLNTVRIGAKPIDFILDISEDFPAEIIGDEIRVQQILNNLLSNAIKYTEAGFVKLTARHKRLGDEVQLIFTVEDSGQGMKKEDLGKLFSRYTRFNTKSNYRTEGTGLGLTITKLLAELMQGEIITESEYGKGSKFTVKIKQAAAGEETIGHETAQNLQNFVYSDAKPSSFKELGSGLANKTMLVVDDVEINLYVVQEMLRFFEIEAETAQSGPEALEKIRAGKAFDIIFMDHMMPEMDGVETTQKLREMGCKSAIIALTANAIEGNAEMFLQNGFDDFLPKPIDASKLNILLHKWTQ